MLDGLRRSDQPGVRGRAIGELLHDLAAFRQDALDGFAWHALGLLAQHLEHLLQAFDLLLGLFAMGGEGLAQPLILRGRFHFRQGFEDLMLGEVDVLQRVKDEIF